MSDVFDRLVGDLNGEERKALLARILSSTKDADFEEPLFREEEDAEPPSLQEAFESLPFLQKLLLKLRSLFRNLPMEDLVEERVLQLLRRRVSRVHPGLLDSRTDRILTSLVDEVDGLRVPFAFLRETFTTAFKDPAFLAFLANIELEPLPQRIWAETDPKAIYQEPACTGEAEIRSEAMFRFDRIVTRIPAEDRELVYRDAQAVEALAALASLRVEELVAQLAPGGSPTGFVEAGRRLRPLCEHLASVRFFPSPTAWQALHLHEAAAAAAERRPEDERELAAFLVQAQSSTAAIRGFLRRVPLIELMRILNKDIAYSPKPAGGGEKWFSLFKEAWERRLQKRFLAYARERRRQSWKEEAAAFLDLSRLPAMEHYAPARFGASYAPRHPDSLSFLRGFYDAVFVPHMERPLKLIYINGDFYKPDNRAAYTDSHEGFVETCRRAAALDLRLSPAGDLGRVAGAGLSETAAQETKAGAGSALQTADTEARRIVDDALKHLQLLSRILHGVLYGEVGGEFDTLVNLAAIGGRENKAIRAGVDAAIQYAQKAFTLLAEIKDLESA